MIDKIDENPRVPPGAQLPRHDAAPVKSATSARQGSVLHRMRYVLIAGVVLVILAFVATSLMTPTPPPEAPAGDAAAPAAENPAPPPAAQAPSPSETPAAPAPTAPATPAPEAPAPAAPAPTQPAPATPAPAAPATP